MSWAKIEIEFQPDIHDANDVMLMLSDYFQRDGMPTAIVTFSGFAPSEPINDIDVMADQMWASWKSNMMGASAKIGAIKELRAIASIGLKEAKTPSIGPQHGIRNDAKSTQGKDNGHGTISTEP